MGLAGQWASGLWLSLLQLCWSYRCVLLFLVFDMSLESLWLYSKPFIHWAINPSLLKARMLQGTLLKYQQFKAHVFKGSQKEHATRWKQGLAVLKYVPDRVIEVSLPRSKGGAHLTHISCCPVDTVPCNEMMRTFELWYSEFKLCVCFNHVLIPGLFPGVLDTQWPKLLQLAQLLGWAGTSQSWGTMKTQLFSSLGIFQIGTQQELEP